MQTKNKFFIFEKKLQNVLQKLRALPLDQKSDEVSVPAYLHKNFLVRKIFIDRFKAAYRMASFTDKIILDYGCGSGLFLESISHEIRKGIGVDLDIEIAKSVVTSERIMLYQIKNHNDLENFSDVDIITSFDVLEHIIDLDSLLNTFTKILGHNGIVIISGPTENFLYAFCRKMAQIGIKGNLKGKEEHVRNIIEIENSFEEAGFKIKKKANLWNLFHIISFTRN